VLAEAGERASRARPRCRSRMAHPLCSCRCPRSAGISSSELAEFRQHRSDEAPLCFSLDNARDPEPVEGLCSLLLIRPPALDVLSLCGHAQPHEEARLARDRNPEDMFGSAAGVCHRLPDS
jgi:hypothetical protein